MHPHRRRKKRPNYGIRTVNVVRGPNGFGFTISGQQPCILSCIVTNSPADQAGLRAGDFLISVNGLSVSKITHDAVVQLIGNSFGPIKMSIAEYYYSDSSDDDVDGTRVASSRKPKYIHKPRTNRKCDNVEKEVKKPVKSLNDDPGTSKTTTQAISPENENSIEYKALVGYLGTIEMPKQLLPSSRLQTVCSCIRKLRQEKRTPSAVLMTVLPSCLSLKNSNNQILAIFPSSRVIYISSSSDKESRYFGLVTSAICEPHLLWQNNTKQEIEISNSCHVFVTDPKLLDHSLHIKNAVNFNITCTPDIITGHCLEFPKNALYVVSLVQNMYRLQNNDVKFKLNDENQPLMANSPQPSASSNSDSGIGFRDDCGNISDRILVVEFPDQRPNLVQVSNQNRPSAIDGTNGLEQLNLEKSNYSVNNIRVKGNGKINSEMLNQSEVKNILKKNREGLMNVRACDGKIAEQNTEFKQPKEPSKKPPIWNRLTVRAMPDPVIVQLDGASYHDEQPLQHGQQPLQHGQQPVQHGQHLQNSQYSHISQNLQQHPQIPQQHPQIPQQHPQISQQHPQMSQQHPQMSQQHPQMPQQHPQIQQYLQQRSADIDTGQIFMERAVDVPNISGQNTGDELSLKGSVDNISVHSARSFDLTTIKSVFKNKNEGKKKAKLNSCEYLTNGSGEEMVNYKLSPKVYGVEWKKQSSSTHSCEELNTLSTLEGGGEDRGVPGGFGSLQDLYSWGPTSNVPRGSALSEPDVRFHNDLCKDSTPEQNATSGGAASWAGTFEKLLEDPLGVQIFAEFLKKEFSAENIYFWTSCERFRRAGPRDLDRSSEAQRIHRRHLCPGATEPVNVDSHARHYTQQQLQDAEPKLFEQAQKQIFNLMKFDSYPRFLKSDLYKQCLSGSISLPPLEPVLLVHPAGASSNPATPSKLKKSLSNAEDRRRKSLLPWHRKIRSKSKDRGETEYQQRREGQDVKGGNSSQSSLTSLDLAMSCSMQDCASSRGSQDDMSTSCHVPSSKGALCRVILSDGATTVVQTRPTETVRQLANRLLDKRGLNYSAYEVHVQNQPKAIDLNDLSSTLSGCEVIIDQRVVFKLDLPNRKVISVKSKTSKILLDVLRPILHKYGFGLDQVQITYTPLTESTVDVSQTVLSVDGKRLNIQLCEENKNELNTGSSTKVVQTGSSLDEITNKVFEQLLQEKAETTSANNMYDRGSVKSEDWGSEHSSGIFGRFLRRDSALHDRKKKLHAMRSHNNLNNIHNTPNNKSQHPVAGQSSSSVEDMTSGGPPGEHVKKPLIAKLKAGVKVQLACSESDELYEGLKRAQRCRLEDQRGTEINFELPDFLKDKENAQNTHKFRKIQQNGETARFYDEEISQKKSNSCPTTPSKFSSLENSLVENDKTLTNSDEINGKISLPPPLPPKPKVLPIKPSNWGQNNFSKVPKINDRTKQTLFLEQPTSSFV